MLYCRKTAIFRYCEAHNREEGDGMALGFPLYINLHGNNCVVLGGGEFALERTQTLLSFGAKVTVISPVLCEGLRHLDEKGRIRYTPRRYFRGDCTSAVIRRLRDQIQQQLPSMLKAAESTEADENISLV